MLPSYTRITAMPRLAWSLGLLLALVGCAKGAGGSAPTPQAKEPAPLAAAAPEHATWHCFAWVHGEDFGDRCFPNAAVCEEARAAAEKVHRETRACRGQRDAVCLGADDGRCYGTMKACLEARARIGADEETTCEARR